MNQAPVKKAFSINFFAITTGSSARIGTSWTGQAARLLTNAAVVERRLKESALDYSLYRTGRACAEPRRIAFMKMIFSPSR